MVYFICQERNARTLKDVRHNWEYVIDRIGENIKMLLGNGELEIQEDGNWHICKNWGLHDQKILV